MTSGSPRRSISSREYGVSAFRVTMAVSLGVKVGVVPDMIEGHLVLRVGFVDRELVHRLVSIDHRESIDMGLLVVVFVRYRLAYCPSCLLQDTVPALPRLRASQ